MYLKFFKKISKNRATCKICSTEMFQSNMAGHFKIKHQFEFVNRQWEDKPRYSGKKSSPWAKYSIEVGENKFQCVICSNILNMPKAHGNLKRHIKLKHPKVYEDETKANLKSFWKQFGINSDEESPTKTKNNEEVVEVEEMVLGEAEYLEEYIDDGYSDETTTIVISDPGKDKSSRKESERGENNSMIDTDVSKNKSDTGEDKSPTREKITYRDIEKIVDTGKFEYVNEDDENFEEKIRWLADRAVPGRKTFRTRIWNFFNEIKKNHLYECKICRRKLAGFTSSSSNLKRHLALVHAKAYEIIANSPNFQKIPKETFSKLHKYIITSKEKSFETSYFVEQGDSKYKCNVCDEVIYSEVADSLVLFKHISEKHSEEVVGGFEEPASDDPEISVVFVDKKDLQIS